MDAGLADGVNDVGDSVFGHAVSAASGNELAISPGISLLNKKSLLVGEMVSNCTSDELLGVVVVLTERAAETCFGSPGERERGVGEEK